MIPDELIPAIPLSLASSADVGMQQTVLCTLLRADGFVVFRALDESGGSPDWLMMMLE